MSHFIQTLQHIGQAISAITQDSVLGKFLVGAGAAITGFLAPVASLLGICFATTIVDMICGIRVARKQNKKIESGKNWKGTLRKIMDEFTIILLAHGIEWSIADQSGVFVLTGGATAIITLTELWSIVENLNTIDPKGPWKVLNKFLKKKGEEYIGINIEDDEYNSDNNVASQSL